MINDKSNLSNLIPVTRKDGDGGGIIIETVNARDLWRFLEVKTRFDLWIERRIREYGFAGDRDYFCTILNKNNNGDGRGRPSKEYDITISMAKELSMVERYER